MARRPRAAQSTREKPDSRWITVQRPFNYTWSHQSALNFHTPGEYRVKNAVADFAVKNGYAAEGKQSEEGQGAAEATHIGSAKVVDSADAADADRPADGPAVDHDAS